MVSKLAFSQITTFLPSTSEQISKLMNCRPSDYPNTSSAKWLYGRKGERKQEKTLFNGLRQRTTKGTKNHGDAKMQSRVVYHVFLLITSHFTTPRGTRRNANMEETSTMLCTTQYLAGSLSFYLRRSRQVIERWELLLLLGTTLRSWPWGRPTVKVNFCCLSFLFSFISHLDFPTRWDPSVPDQISLGIGIHRFQTKFLFGV